MIRGTSIIGIDPGLRHTGWGIIQQSGNRLSFIAAGRINPPTEGPMAERLRQLAQELRQILETHRPDDAAIEETFVNKDGQAALKLGQARGAAMLVLAEAGLSVAEYAANRIKQSVTGYGHADKKQVQAMIRILLPGIAQSTGTKALPADAADALAVAIAHAHHR
ncbi:MAG: crossover junction endodeoxyribonuclease RuvC [Alphaproteobacteria bacterium]|nr:crossover junction endodeoxyribonuclease RuvC [Alphaproteobacteria bacterium]MBV8548195.1 crossover junction endodeoxyribonuclease RuvC [Alphaproteobacteria bacterium]